MTILHYIPSIDEASGGVGGASLPDHSVLAAGAVLNKPQPEPYSLYGGVPAKRIKDIPKNAKYMNREKGFVY